MKKDEVIIVLNSSRFGQGNPKLGEKLMKLFFDQLIETQARPAAVLMYNSAVILACEDSPILESLQTLIKEGTEVLVNEESLDFYNLNPSFKAGESSSLDVMSERMLNAQTIIQP